MKTLWMALAAACATLLGGVSLAENEKENAKHGAEQSIPELSMEMQALRTLNNLRLTPEQMKSMVKLAKESAQPSRKRNQPTVSADYRKALTELRDALAEATDDDKIEQVEDAFTELHEKENPDLDDGVEVTTLARKHAADLFKKMKPSQVASYLGYLADEVADPVDVLRSTMKDIRAVKNEEWKDQRDDLAEELGWLLGGVEEKKSKKVNDEVIALLNKAKALSDADFKAKQGELDKAAEQLAGEVGPERVLRNKIERTLAELLSNPRLEAALAGRLKDR